MILIAVINISPLHMYICLCKGITDSKVRQLGQACHQCPELLAMELGIDDEECCRRCIRNIRGLMAMAATEAKTGTAVFP